MKTMLSRTLVCLSLLTALAATPNPVLARELNIPPETQEKSKWCWAATCQMVLDYYGVSRTQTQLAEWVFVLAEDEPLPLHNTATATSVSLRLIADRVS